MPIFLIMILFSLIFYLYYKVNAIRSKKPNERKMLSAKSSIALGLFVAIFGLNRIFISQTTIAITIGILFILVGSISIWTGFRAYKFYLPYVVKEANDVK